MNVLNDLKSRGVLDVYLFCTDGLCGMMQAIEADLPKKSAARCIVHQVRSSTRYVSYKDIKKVVADLKKIYSAVTLEEAEKNLQAFAEAWRKQYPSCVKSWEENWPVLSTFFEYPVEIQENHIHDEHHRGPESPVPADHEEQALLHERRLPAPDAVSGLPAHRETLARQIPELGSVLSQLAIMFATEPLADSLVLVCHSGQAGIHAVPARIPL